MANVHVIDNQSNIAFRNLKDAKLFALDIGGSLTKIAYYSTGTSHRILYRAPEKISLEALEEKRKRIQRAKTEAGMKCRIEIQDEEAIVEINEDARLHFVKFETRQIEKCLDYVRDTLMNSQDFSPDRAKTINVTGGGAYKYADLISEKLGLTVTKVDEMSCICAGANFLLKNIADESFIYERTQMPHYVFQSTNSPVDLYPYLLVTIGSGVSVIKVTSEDDFERIGGTATGGGTFWGLGKLLTGANGFDELLEMATHGDFRQVDMLVKDIYGDRNQDDYTSSLGLSPTVIASSFGKAIHQDTESPSWSKADMARSLLYLVSNDIGQISTLYAMLHSIKRIYFGGFFLRHHPVGLHTISYAVNFWSKGQVSAYFLRHEGYLGAIGAFIKGAGNTYQTDLYSWTENLYGSSSFPGGNLSLDDQEQPIKIPNVERSASMVSTGTTSPSASSSSLLEVTDHLEIDRFDTRLGICPLLSDPFTYNPDTVDLTRDSDARSYWLKCFEDSLDKFAERAVDNSEHCQDAPERAEKFKEQYLNRLKSLQMQPCAHGNLTVRSLLDMREHCLVEFNFHDPYMKQKQMENQEALALLQDRLTSLENLPFDELHEQLALGLLAGNVFDWGAKEVALLMESRQGLKFEDALKFVNPRPWLVDNLDEWKERLQKQPPHKCAAIFIDNSGVDIILGIIPFATELLK